MATNIHNNTVDIADRRTPCIINTGIPLACCGVKNDGITAEALTKKLPMLNIPFILSLIFRRRKCSARPPPIENPPMNILSNWRSNSDNVGISYK